MLGGHQHLHGAQPVLLGDPFQLVDAGSVLIDLALPIQLRPIDDDAVPHEESLQARGGRVTAYIRYVQ